VSLSELRRHIQKKNTTTVVREEELQQILALPEMEVVRIRELYVSGRTGNEANDKLRTVLHALLRGKDTVTMQDVAAEFERVHGEPCKVSSYVLRGFLREVAEKLDGAGETWVLKGALVRSDAQ